MNINNVRVGQLIITAKGEKGIVMSIDKGEHTADVKFDIDRVGTVLLAGIEEGE